MISDRKALSVRAEANDCVISFEGGDTPELGSAQLLLDDRGALVGVDLGGSGLGRVAVMIGAHEDVASQRPARISVGPGTLRIHGEAGLVVRSRAG
ncbi:MAG TPA: hypothetical protein VGH28_17785 [Polyangiaceae bacterium]